MLINISNHPSKGWGEAQKKEAIRLYGSVHDVAFPAVSPEATTDDIRQLARQTLTTAQTLAQADGEHLPTLHVMGEMTLTAAIVRIAQEAGLTCVASTTERIVVDGDNGTKTSIFNFVKFRQYV